MTGVRFFCKEFTAEMFSQKLPWLTSAVGGIPKTAAARGWTRQRN
jgi:hypothetical protein